MRWWPWRSLGDRKAESLRYKGACSLVEVVGAECAGCLAGEGGGGRRSCKASLSLSWQAGEKRESQATNREGGVAWPQATRLSCTLLPLAQTAPLVLGVQLRVSAGFWCTARTTLCGKFAREIWLCAVAYTHDTHRDTRAALL